MRRRSSALVFWSNRPAWITYQHEMTMIRQPTPDTNRRHTCSLPIYLSIHVALSFRGLENVLLNGALAHGHKPQHPHLVFLPDAMRTVLCGSVSNMSEQPAGNLTRTHSLVSVVPVCAIRHYHLLSRVTTNQAAEVGQHTWACISWKGFQSLS